jgi:hypothetical protein
MLPHRDCACPPWASVPHAVVMMMIMMMMMVMVLGCVADPLTSLSPSPMMTPTGAMNAKMAMSVSHLVKVTLARLRLVLIAKPSHALCTSTPASSTDTSAHIISENTQHGRALGSRRVRVGQCFS